MKGQVRVDVFHVGAQKAGTTWAYRCMKEHPQIACPPTDALHYFDMHPTPDEAWLADHYRGAAPGQLIVDPTPSYLRSPVAPERIHAHNADAKLICCLRHPLQRAFSHYWHEKKKGKIRFAFSEVTRNYDLFTSWVETGFYARHLERYLACFPREQILVQWFDNLESDPGAFIKELYEFIGIDRDFTPSILHRRVNKAVSARYTRSTAIRNRARRFLEASGFGRSSATLERFVFGTNMPEESLVEVEGDVIRHLRSIFEPEIVRLEGLLNVDLTHWKQAPDVS